MGGGTGFAAGGEPILPVLLAFLPSPAPVLSPCFPGGETWAEVREGPAARTV